MTTINLLIKSSYVLITWPLARRQTLYLISFRINHMLITINYIIRCAKSKNKTINKIKCQISGVVDVKFKLKQTLGSDSCEHS